MDTYHLFPETMEFLDEIETHYGFKAEVFAAEGCVDKAAYDAKYGADLWKEDIEQYDKVRVYTRVEKNYATIVRILAMFMSVP